MTTIQADAEIRIAIIGTEGAGKTVFLAALAQRLNGTNGQPWLLNPLNPFTNRYVTAVWEKLQLGDWPPATPLGTIQKLIWRFQANKDNNRISPGLWNEDLPAAYPFQEGKDDKRISPAELRIIDPPGHDIRRLFLDDDLSVPADMRALYEYCRTANIVLILVNLADFLGEVDPARRVANQDALKFALDKFRSAPQYAACCIVLTQADLHADSLREAGGPAPLIKRHLPIVHATHVAEGSLPVYAAAAVNRTRVIADPESPGKMLRVPDTGFQSEGLDNISQWIAERIERSQAVAKARAEAEAKAEAATRAAAELEAAAEAKAQWWRDVWETVRYYSSVPLPIILAFVTCLFGLFIVRGCDERSPDYSITKQYAIPGFDRGWHVEWKVGNDDRLEKKIAGVVDFYQGGYLVKSQRFGPELLKPGYVKTYNYTFWGYDSWSGNLPKPTLDAWYED